VLCVACESVPVPLVVSYVCALGRGALKYVARSVEWMFDCYR